MAFIRRILHDLGGKVRNQKESRLPLEGFNQGERQGEITECLIT